MYDDICDALLGGSNVMFYIRITCYYISNNNCIIIINNVTDVTDSIPLMMSLLEHLYRCRMGEKKHLNSIWVTLEKNIFPAKI